MDAPPDALSAASLRSSLDWMTAALAAGEPVDVFHYLGALRRDLDRFEGAYLRYLNDSGHTWADVGKMCDLSKQAAFNRYKRLMK